MAFPAEPVDSNNIPISSSYDPSPIASFIAMQSSPYVSTDASTNTSTAAMTLPAWSTHGLPFVTPCIAQKISGVTGSGAKTLAVAFTNNNIAGNSIVISMGMGEVEASGITLAITDSAGNSYTQAVKGSNSTTQEAAIFYATNILPGANTVTVTIAGASSTNTAIAMEIYEVQGLITVASLIVDQSNSNSSAGSTAVTTATITPNYANELAFMAVAAAGGTITAGTGWLLDSGSLAPTGGNLVSFASESRFQMSAGPIVPAATLGTSNAWAACTAVFRSMHLQQEGTHLVQSGFTEVVGSAGALNADIVNMDVSNYKWVSVHVGTNAYSGTLTFQGSNDNVNWIAVTFTRVADASGFTAASFTASTNIMYSGPVQFRYFRVRMTSYTSGSAQGTIEFYTAAPSWPMLGAIAYEGGTWNVAQSGVWSVGLTNGDITAISSAAYTTTQTQADQTNTAAKGIRVVLNVTSAGTGSITLEIDAKDVASGSYISLLTGVAVTTISTNVYVVYPGLTATANAIASDVLPRTWRIKVVANNANSMTYSVGATYLL